MRNARTLGFRSLIGETAGFVGLEEQPDERNRLVIIRGNVGPQKTCKAVLNRNVPDSRNIAESRQSEIYLRL